jgi:hypothetical protein
MKNNQRGSALIVLLIIIAVVVIGSGAYYLSTKGGVSGDMSSSSELSETPYTFPGTPNGKYKRFTMNFPKGWTVKETIPGGGDSYFEVRVTDSSGTGLASQIIIYQSTFPDQFVQPGKTPAKTFDEYVQTSDLKKQNPRPYTINGINGYLIGSANEWDNGQYRIILVTNPPTDQKTKELLEKSRGTFKFKN